MTKGAPEPPALFQAVSNDTRLSVLQALADSYSESPGDPWLAYSDLRAAVGARDKGNFNYHLDQLGDLVVRGDRGYRLSRVGMEVISTIASGNLDPEWSWGPVDAPGACRECGDDLVLRYEDGVLRLTCGVEAHDIPMSVSPTLLTSRPEDEVVDAIAYVTSSWGGLLRRNVCSECGGYVDGAVERHHEETDSFHYHGRCGSCGFHHGMAVGSYLYTHPTVRAFYREVGVRVRERPFWTFEFTALGAETVLSTEPLRLRVDGERDDATLSLTVDADGDIVETEKVADTSGGGG